MRLKTVIFLVLAMTAGVVFSSYFIGGILTTQVIAPFSSVNSGESLPSRSEITDVNTGVDSVVFVDAELIDGWIPWVIKQISILIGGLSLIVFVYAGIMLIIYGDNEEQLTKSSKMIIFGVIGIALAAFSYSIVANVLSLF